VEFRRIASSLRKALTADEQTFIEKAATSEQTEIRPSQLAVERASSPEVKQFAQSMVTDQSASLLKPIAADYAVALPENLGPEINEKFKRLKKQSGIAFDKTCTEPPPRRPDDEANWHRG
jgi:putative membrane protein